MGQGIYMCMFVCVCMIDLVDAANSNLYVCMHVCIYTFRTVFRQAHWRAEVGRARHVYVCTYVCTCMLMRPLPTCMYVRTCVYMYTIRILILLRQELAG